LLAHDQHAREIEAERERRLLDDVQQRERDLRRDMYDLAAQRSRASAFEAEFKSENRPVYRSAGAVC